MNRVDITERTDFSADPPLDQNMVRSAAALLSSLCKMKDDARPFHSCSFSILRIGHLFQTRGPVERVENVGALFIQAGMHSVASMPGPPGDLDGDADGEHASLPSAKTDNSGNSRPGHGAGEL